MGVNHQQYTGLLLECLQLPASPSSSPWLASGPSECKIKNNNFFGKHSLLITDTWWSNLRILWHSNFCRSFPINFILLALFTAAESVIVGQVSGSDKNDKSNSKVLRKLHNISRHHDEHHHHYPDQHQHDLRQRWCTTGRCWWSRWPPRPFLSSPSLSLLSRY